MSEAPTKRPKKKSCCFGCGFLALLPILFIAFAFTPSWKTQNAPVSVEEARKLGCPILLPDSARNVQFAWYDQWVISQTYVRFEADPAVCHAHAKTLVEDNVKRVADIPVSNQTDLTSLTSAPQNSLLQPGRLNPLGSLPWFNIQDIKHGSFRHGIVSYDPDIWIDDDKGIFYYRNTD